VRAGKQSSSWQVCCYAVTMARRRRPPHGHCNLGAAVTLRATPCTDRLALGSASALVCGCPYSDSSKVVGNETVRSGTVDRPPCISLREEVRSIEGADGAWPLLPVGRATGVSGEAARLSLIALSTCVSALSDCLRCTEPTMPNRPPSGRLEPPPSGRLEPGLPGLLDKRLVGLPALLRLTVPGKLPK